jgi:hypothetical protein
LAGGAADPPLRFEDGAVWHDAAFEETPQGDQQLAGKGHDHGALEATGGGADAGVEPAGKGGVGLPVEPEPGEFDGGVPGPPVAGLADALLAMATAAGEGGGVEPAIGRELAPVAEAAIEDLALQNAGDFWPDAAQLLEMSDAAARAGRIGLARYRILAWSPARRRRVAVALEFGDLALDELEPLDLAADLDGQARGSVRSSPVTRVASDARRLARRGSKS